MPQTVIIRHKRERLSKCSLRGLQARPECHFLRYPLQGPSLEPLNCQLLRLDFTGPLLTASDRSRPLLLLDATWRWVEQMERHPRLSSFERRSLDSAWKTAYPRRQLDCADPDRGLASIEALYAAWLQIGCEELSLLEGYYWRDAFLKANESLIAKWRTQGISGESARC